MKKIGLLLALLGALAACAVPADEATAALAPGRDARLTLYTSHKQAVYGPIVKEFREETGIWVEVITGGTNELLERIAAEAEQPVCDVMFGGGVESLCAYESCFEPYACAGADRLREGLRPEGDAWTPFSSLPLVFIYNPKLVEPDQLTGWADLIDPGGRAKSPSPTPPCPAPAIRRPSRCCPVCPATIGSCWSSSRPTWTVTFWPTPATWWARWPTAAGIWASPWRRPRSRGWVRGGDCRLPPR